nr:hypothetical protein D5086_0000070700 [Ipomoea batatas]
MQVHNVDLGTAPITASLFSPFLKIMTVGMLRIPSSITGWIIRHGPHHGAQNSTRTGRSQSRTSDCHVSSETGGTTKFIKHNFRSSSVSGMDATKHITVVYAPAFYYISNNISKAIIVSLLVIIKRKQLKHQHINSLAVFRASQTIRPPRKESLELEASEAEERILRPLNSEKRTEVRRPEMEEAEIGAKGAEARGTVRVSNRAAMDGRLRYGKEEE